MALFDLFKKKEAPQAQPTFPMMLAAAANGTVVPMEQIPDDIFNSGVLGFCVGIDPAEGAVYAPADGKISQVADSLHAIGMELAGGIELLIHVGVDTVEMNGDGFDVQVKLGQQVKQGQLLMKMDLTKIKAAGHPTVVINAVTNSDDFEVACVAGGSVTVGADFIKVNK